MKNASSLKLLADRVPSDYFFSQRESTSGLLATKFMSCNRNTFFWYTSIPMYYTNICEKYVYALCPLWKKRSGWCILKLGWKRMRYEWYIQIQMYIFNFYKNLDINNVICARYWYPHYPYIIYPTHLSVWVRIIYIYWRIKSIFNHPTLDSVWFWLLNSKTGYP